MGRYILKRLIMLFFVILGIILITFLLSYISPGDPVKAILGTDYTEAQYQQLRTEMGLDRPFIVQYLDYVWGVFTRFDLGTSYKTGTAVAVEVGRRIGISIRIGLLGVLFTAILGIPLGIVSATKQYSVLDSAVTGLSMFLAAMPNFWLALMMILLFSLKLNWLPVTGIGTWKHLVMPVVSSAMCGVAIVVRMTRSSMLEVIRQEYITTVRAKGLKEGVIIRDHALRNALIPIVTVLGMQMGSVIGGGVIIETIFSIPGMGMYMMNGISSRDYPVVMGSVLVLSLFTCILNLVVDILYAYIDPTIKAQYDRGRKRKTPEKKEVVSS